MPINVLTSLQDEDDLVKYIYKRGGYSIVYRPGSRPFSDGPMRYRGRLGLNGREDPSIRFYHSIC